MKTTARAIVIPPRRERGSPRSVGIGLGRSNPRARRDPTGNTLLDAAQGGLGSSARSLDPVTRNRMESKLGHDLSAIRIHDDEKARASAKTLTAEAFTVGRDIVFSRTMTNFDGKADRELLTHELIHAVQSETADTRHAVRAFGAPTANRAAEGEADRLSRGLAVESPRERVAAGTVLPRLLQERKDFHDPNFCYRPGSPRDATHPDRSRVVAVMQAEIETPDTCEGDVVLRTSVLQSGWGAASAEFESYGGGESQGVYQSLHRDTNADRVDYEERFHLDTCHAFFDRCHLITYYEGGTRFVFAEAGYRPRISATSTSSGTDLHDRTRLPLLDVQPCDNLTPSLCRS